MPVEVDYKALSFYLQLANTLGLVLVAIYSWNASRHKANASAIESLRDSVLTDMTLVQSRFATLESEIKHLPTHSDIGAVHEKINDVAKVLSTMNGEIIQMNSGMKLIHQYLLNNKGS